MRRHIFFLACLLFINFFSCKTIDSGTKNLAIGRISKVDLSQQKIQQAEKLYTHGDLSAAIDILQEFVKKTTKDPNLEQAYILLIRFLIEDGQNTKARKHASDFLTSFPRSPQYQKIIKLFEKKQNNLSEYRKKFEALENKLKYSRAQNNIKNITQPMHDLILHQIPLDLVLELWEDASRKYTWGSCGQRLAQYFLHIGDTNRAYKIINRAWKHENQFSKTGLETIRVQIDSLSRPKFPVVGLLLPLSGPFKNFGVRALNAISIALKTNFNNLPQDVSKNYIDGVTWVLADSQGNPDVARSQTESLIHKHKAHMILGDIVADCAHAAAQVAQSSGIPILSFTRHPQITQIGSQVFSFVPTYEQEISHLAHYAVKIKKYTRFGVLYPKHNYGIQLAELFTQKITQLGGEIRALEPYDAHETTFTTTIKKLTGKHYLDARPEYILCKEQAQKDSASNTQKKLLKKCQKNLHPMVDFEALFIPEITKIPFVVPALVSADILISPGEKEKKRFSLTTKIENPQYVQLLGTSGWNQSTIITTIARLAEGSFFINIRYQEALKPKSIFYEDFLNITNSPPRVLELFLHDGAKLAQLIMKEKTEQNFNKAIKNYRGSLGLLGPVSFDTYGNIQVMFSGYEIRAKQVQKITSIFDAA